MKERMKKLTLLTFYKEKKQITDKLQEIGVLHIESPEALESDDLTGLKKEVDDWKRAVELLSEYHGDEEKEPIQVEEIFELKNKVFELIKEKEQLANQLENVRKQEEQLSHWGQFDWKKVKGLEKYQVYTRFYVARKKEFRAFDFEDIVVETIRETNSKVYFVVFIRDNTIELPFEKSSLPGIDLSELISSKKQLSQKIEDIEFRLAELTYAIPALRQMQKAAEDKFSNLEVLESFEEKARGKIAIIKGWFPEKKESQLLKFINDNGLSFEFKEPEPGDHIPIILKNRKYPKIFETITGIFQLPDYYEFDLTPFIAVFYPIFFAYCLGDAGYGVILLLISIVAWFTFLKNVKGVALLGSVLGVATLVMGIIKSGTVFGIPITEQKEIPLFGFLSKYVIVTDSQDYVFNAFNVALMIGVFQILVAVMISIYKKIKYEGFVQSLSTVGKLLMIVSLITIFLGAIQNVEIFVPYISLAKIVLVVGVVMVLVFHDTMVSLPKRIGSGILPLYFIVTGLLGDVLSYIRLFALGVASSILGLVVNQIGSQILDGAGVVGIAGGALFLIVGHSLNLLLACLGAFVHPLRLTFVEFYNNAEFKGGGIEYRPFKKQIVNDISDIKQ